MGSFVRLQGLPVAHGFVPELAFWRPWTALEVVERFGVRGDEARFGAALDRHVADRHAAFHGKGADRFAGIFERVAGAAGGADLADDGKDDVLGGDAREQLAVNDGAHVLRLGLDQRLCRQHMLDLGRADAVGERAEGAMGRSVAVAADQRRAGEREALLGPDDVHDALAPVELVEIFQPEQLGVLGEIRDLGGTFGIGIGRLAVGGGDVVVDHTQRLLRRAHGSPGEPQPLEGLRAGHLMHEMTVDIDETGAVRLFVDQMSFPDLVVERARHCYSAALSMAPAPCSAPRWSCFSVMRAALPRRPRR